MRTTLAQERPVTHGRHAVIWFIFGTGVGITWAYSRYRGTR
jgi:hypothetical protein